MSFRDVRLVSEEEPTTEPGVNKPDKLRFVEVDEAAKLGRAESRQKNPSLRKSFHLPNLTDPIPPKGARRLRACASRRDRPSIETTFTNFFFFYAFNERHNQCHAQSPTQVQARRLRKGQKKTKKKTPKESAK